MDGCQPLEHVSSGITAPEQRTHPPDLTAFRFPRTFARCTLFLAGQFPPDAHDIVDIGNLDPFHLRTGNLDQSSRHYGFRICMFVTLLRALWSVFLYKLL